MSFEQDAWKEFVSQIKNDTNLGALNPTFKVGFKEEIFSATNYPLVVISLFGIENEERMGIPKKKQVDIIGQISGKVKSQTSSQEDMIVALLNLDEKIKNAIEKDLQLATKANNVFIGDSDFNQLADDYSELTFNVSIKTNPFTMGSR